MEGADNHTLWNANLKHKCEGIYENNIESYQGSGVFQLEKAICYNKEYNSRLISLKTKEINEIPKFKNYLISNIYQNPNHPLIEKDFGKLYRTRLNQALKEKKPEFAGKYILAQWGCDEDKEECTTGGIIDASTGEAIPFPLKYYAHNGEKEIIYKLDSSLIIFAGDFELEDSTKETNQVRFYEMKDGEFLFLKSTPYKQ